MYQTAPVSALPRACTAPEAHPRALVQYVGAVRERRKYRGPRMISRRPSVCTRSVNYIVKTVRRDADTTGLPTPLEVFCSLQSATQHCNRHRLSRPHTSERYHRVFIFTAPRAFDHGSTAPADTPNSFLLNPSCPPAPAAPNGRVSRDYRNDSNNTIIMQQQTRQVMHRIGCTTLYYSLLHGSDISRPHVHDVNAGHIRSNIAI